VLAGTCAAGEENLYSCGGSAEEIEPSPPADASGGGGTGGRPDASPAPPPADAPPAPSGDASTLGDRDLDGVADAEDCDPDRADVLDRVLYDPLSAAAPFAPALGFPATWEVSGGAYRQTRLADDADDASFYTGPPLEHVRIMVRAASTGVTEFDATDLSQLFVVARAASDGTSFRGEACGIEIDERELEFRKTSEVTLGGSPLTVASTVRDRVTRHVLLPQGAEFEMTMELRGDTMICTVTAEGETTTASWTGLAVTAGAVGFYTRETRALFRNLRICRLAP
jgi:hypothetical protein